MGADEAFVRPVSIERQPLDSHNDLRPLLVGEEVRDWNEQSSELIWYPYIYGTKEPIDKGISSELWPFRTLLAARGTFQGAMADAGLRWWEYMQHTYSPYVTPLSIAFAFIATHNHFVLDRGGKVFKQSAPVIKLPEGASEDDHLQLLGVLNSSVACFWLKQNSQKKGGGGHGGGAADRAWSHTYEFTGTTLKDFPLPSVFPLARARSIDELAQGLAANTPSAVAAESVPTAHLLDRARSGSERVRGLMIAQQEELDWETYRLYGLLNDDLTYVGELPGIALGERAFEIVLARAVADGEDAAWFEQHRSAPVTTIPAHLPAEYQTLLQRRLDAIASNPGLRLLERPENKRRWAIDLWDKRVTRALRDWLLDRVEDAVLWFDANGRPTPRSVAQLADLLDRDPDFRRVLRLWVSSPEASTSAALKTLLADEGVPFLAAYRYTPSGLEKRTAWEHTWALQRREDAGERLGTPIPVPPMYKSTDFAKGPYWSRRGKLDVPKERFVSYPNAGRANDPTELLGWAGWDHAQQALALAELIDERIQDGAGAAVLTPLLAGLAELLPWVQQWHTEVLPDFGASMAEIITEELRSRCAQIGVSAEEAATWRPAAPVRGRSKKKETTA